MTSGETTSSDLLVTIRRELGATTTHILGYTEILQEQAEDAGQEAFLADLYKIQGAGKQLVKVIHELTGDAITQDEAMDFARLGFEVRSAVNHIVGYIEMLQERAQELGLGEFSPELERVHAACWQLIAQTETVARESSGGAAPSNRADAEGEPLTFDEAARKAGLLLVVDDHIQNRRLLARELRLQGYGVVHVGSGPAAMARLREENFDAVLLDVVMPGMSGYEVLQWLKADPQLRHLPVLMVAAMNDIENIVRCLVIGADDYVAKPCDPILLRTRVSACLERQRWRRREEDYLRQIAEERARSEHLLKDSTHRPPTEGSEGGSSGA